MMEDTALDPLLQTLSACSHLRRVVIMTRCSSTGAIQNLPQLAKDAHLTLETDHWSALTDGIRQGRCNINTDTSALMNSKAQDPKIREPSKR
jgi:hypothetical protein